MEQDIISKIIYETKTRFEPYINRNILNISIIKSNKLYEISINIILDSDILRKELKKIFTKEEQIEEQIEHIVSNKNLIEPSLEGYISEDECKIMFVKTGLFTSNSNVFTPKQILTIEKLLGNKGIGSLLVLIFIYLFYKWKDYFNTNINSITLDDASSYYGWYANMGFNYINDDEEAELMINPDNFFKLQKNIFKYIKKGRDNNSLILGLKDFNTFNLELLSEVSKNFDSYNLELESRVTKRFNDKEDDNDDDDYNKPKRIKNLERGGGIRMERRKKSRKRSRILMSKSKMSMNRIRSKKISRIIRRRNKRITRKYKS